MSSNLSVQYHHSLLLKCVNVALCAFCVWISWSCLCVLCAVVHSLPLSLWSCNRIWFHPNQLLSGHSRDTVINEVIIHALVGLVDEEDVCELRAAAVLLQWYRTLKDELVESICLYSSCMLVDLLQFPHKKIGTPKIYRYCNPAIISSP